MAQTDALAQAAMKKLFGLGHTEVKTFPAGNESDPSALTIIDRDIYTESIPSTAGETAGRIIAATNATAGQQDSRLTLTVNPADTGGEGVAYYITVPASHDLIGENNPYDGSTFAQGDRVRSIVPKRFGDTCGPKVFDGSGVEIAPLAVDWWVDEKAGIVYFRTAPATTPTTLECHVYVGKTLTNSLTSIALTDLSDVTISAPVTGQLLRKSSTDWINSGLTAADLPTHAHDGPSQGGQLNATNVFNSGTVPTAQLGSGTANATTFLRGDQTWAVPAGGSGGHTIQEEGTPLTARANLNFIGSGITAADGGAGPDSTTVTLDATLNALAGLTTAADKLPYFTGVDTAAVTDLSAFIRTLLDDANAATARATLGAGTGNGTVTSVTGTLPIVSSGGATPDISLNDTAVTPASYGSATQVGTFTVDQKGRLTAASNTAIAITSAAVTDFNTAARAATGWIDNGTTVSLVTAADEVFVGAAQILTAKFSIDGGADQVQFAIQGHSTQTANLVTWENSAGTDLFNFSNVGLMTVTGHIKMPVAGEHRFRDDANRIYSSATGLLDIDAATTVNVGHAGHVGVGPNSGSTDYALRPRLNNIMHLGQSTFAWMDAAILRKLNWWDTAGTPNNLAYIDHDGSNWIFEPVVGKVRINKLEFGGSSSASTIANWDTNGSIFLLPNGTGSVVITAKTLDMDATGTTGAIRFGDTQTILLMATSTTEMECRSTSSSGGAWHWNASTGLTEIPRFNWGEASFQLKTTTKEIWDWSSGSFKILQPFSPKAGASQGAGPVDLKCDTTKTGNVGTGEDNLILYTVQANELGATNHFVELECWGTYGATVNTKQIKVYFGASAAVFDSTALAVNSGKWYLKVRIARTGAATQKCAVEFASSSSLLNSSVGYLATSESMTANKDIKVTGTATANDDITMEFYTVRWGRDPGA